MGKGDLVILFSPQLLAGSGEWRYLGLCGPGSVGHCGKSPPPHTHTHFTGRARQVRGKAI